MAFDNTMDDAAAAFGNLAPAPTNAQVEADDRRRDEEDEGGDDEQELQPIDESVEGAQEPEPVEEESEADDEQDDEPAAPAIDPPVSWDAEGKELFARLPPELQQKLGARESEREKFVQAKATEAAQNRKAADALSEHNAQLHRQFSEQLDTYAQALQPQRPDYALLATDPQAFAQQMTAFETANAQRDYLAQQSTEARRQAEHIEQQQALRQQDADDADLAQSIPEWSDTSKRTEILTGVVEMARKLGFPDELIRQARPVDIRAMHQLAGTYADAEKYRALQKAKMEPVRAAKLLPKVSKPGAAQPKGSARAQGLQDSMTRLRSSGDVKDAAAAFRNLR